MGEAASPRPARTRRDSLFAGGAELRCYGPESVWRFAVRRAVTGIAVVYFCRQTPDSSW